MSKTQYYCAATLDGYIADAEDGIGWLTGYRGSYDAADAEPGPRGEGGPYERFYDGIGALVSGSTTYQFLVDHAAGGRGWLYSGKPYWVLSSREPPVPDGEDIRVVNAGVDAILDEMMSSAGDGNLWVVGGGNVASQFADKKLLDELLVTVVPIVLGGGKPLFDRPVAGGPLQLTGTRTFNTGLVELRYALKD